MIFMFVCPYAFITRDDVLYKSYTGLVPNSTLQHWAGLLPPPALAPLQPLEELTPGDGSTSDNDGAEVHVEPALATLPMQRSSQPPSPPPPPGPVPPVGAPAPVLPRLPQELLASNGSFPTRGLKIRQPWLGYILEGRKKWELRGAECAHVGTVVALVEVGKKRIVATARIVNSFKVNDDTLAERVDLHCVEDYDTNPHLEGYRQNQGVFAWLLDEVRLLDPIFVDTTSAVMWEKLERHFSFPDLDAPAAAHGSVAAPTSIETAEMYEAYAASRKRPRKSAASQALM